MYENQVKFHLFPYIAIVTSPYMTHEITKVRPVECSPIFTSSGMLMKRFDEPKYFYKSLLFKMIPSIKSFPLFLYRILYPSWMGSLLKRIQLMLEFIRAPFMVLHFFYFKSMTSWGVMGVSDGSEDILFSKKNSGCFGFVIFPWKFQRKGSFTRGNSAKLCDTPWKFQGQKPRPMKIPHLFLITPGNSTSFLTDPGIFTSSLFNTHKNSMSLTPPVWIFFLK